MGPTIPNGRRISRYLSLRQLGHGNLTRVFLSTMRAGERAELCVLKLMRNELANDDDFRALFLDQAATTLALRHPNLVRTLDVVSDIEGCGLTMEFLDGQTLARVIERTGRSRFPVDVHLHILSKVLDALDYAHELARAGSPEPGFLHRDVCPSNVFITYDGQVKLMGTGFAETMRALEGKLGRPLADVRYAAPEVLRGHPGESRADLFGVGIMLWEAVARQARVSAEDPAAVVQQRIEGEEPDLESVWPDAPLPVLEMCRRALAIDPGERYGSATELRSDLDAYLGRASQSSDAVLQRLAESTQTLFAAERQQMQLFIGASLESASDPPRPAPERARDTDDELTPHEEEWNGPTSTHIAALDLHATGNLAVATSAATESGPNGDVTSEPAAPPSQRGTPHSLTPFDIAAARDSSGHRAYSTSLEGRPRRRPRRARVSPDLLGAAALIIGSIVAAYSLHRHSTRDKTTESEQLAIQAEGRHPTAPAPPAHARPRGATDPTDMPHGPAPTVIAEPARPKVEAPPPAEPDGQPQRATPHDTLRALGGADAGSGEERSVSPPAFFDGKAAPNIREHAAPFSAEDLPTVDPELSSLQEAILSQARARQLAQKQKREKKPAAAATPPRHAGRLTRPRAIDDADHYGEPPSE
jgi:serine/threonine protein kinase